jgi:hypothetical protein
MTNLPPDLFEEAFHLLLLWHFDGVARDKELVGEVAEGELHKGLVFAGAKEDANGGLVARCHLVLFVVGNVGVELTEVLVGEGGRFEFDQDMALENPVIEDQVHKEMLVADEEALLPGFETEAMSHFEEKVLESIQQGVFEVRLAHDIAGAQAEELEDVRIADDLAWMEGLCLGVGLDGKPGFVF